MNVLNIHRASDTGAWGIRLFWAFRRHAPGWVFRSMYRPNSYLYMEFPQDLPWADAREWWKWADVVHLHNDFRTAKVMEARGAKPAVIQLHGSQFRDNPRMVLDEMRKRGAIGIVSTLDLYLLAPDDLTWVGSPYDLEWLWDLRQQALSEKAA